METLRRRARRMQDALSPEEWTRVVGMALTVVVLNALGWGLLVLALHAHAHISKTAAFGLGTGVLAYTLGMRHAFDADHIAAIDNTTRKLVNDGKRPLGVGYFFSLGHSSVVFVLAVLLNFGFRSLNGSISSKGSSLHLWTGIVGTSVSGAFLWLIGILNLVVLISIVKVARELRSGRFDDEELEKRLAERGFMNRILGSYAKRIDAPWKMYPIGVLFGLGFDTVTEVALLVLAGSAVIQGLPFYAVISLPILFAAGMCLFDTLDGCFMNFAYDWAFAKPVRKIYYNLTITGLSVVIAMFIGTVELVGLLAQQTGLSGPFWGPIERFNINRAGFVIVGLFVVTWVVALCIWHFGKIERRWESEAEAGRASRSAGGEDRPGDAATVLVCSDAREGAAMISDPSGVPSETLSSVA